MPRKPWKLIKENQDLKLTADREAHLTLGINLLDSLDGRDSRFPFWSSDHRKRVWERHRDAIMAKRRFTFFGQPRLGDGTAPAAYYQYQHGLVLNKDFGFTRELAPNRKTWFYRFKPLTKKAKVIQEKV